MHFYTISKGSAVVGDVIMWLCVQVGLCGRGDCEIGAEVQEQRSCGAEKSSEHTHLIQGSERQGVSLRCTVSS